MANNENDSDAPQVYLLGKTFLANNQGQFFIRNDPIIHMAAGDQHTIIVTQTGRAFAFGQNSSGQLGLGHTNSVEKVSCIKSLKFGDTGERVLLAACGRDSSLVATNRGSLYAFGSNSRSQLGIESSDSKTIYSEPVKIEQFRGKINWKQIAMGAEHSCALTDDGQVYIWGGNDDGQCGQPRKIDTVKTPRELRVEHQISYISCGYYHTALVTEDGRLFVFGNNDDRQLGRSIPDKFAGPLEVSIPNKVKSVACGNQHTVVLTDKGEVYTCGLGDRGQLGLGLKVLSAETFESVQTLPKRLIAIAAGEAHTVVLGSRGEMYVCGDGKHGKLGPATHCNEFQPCLVDKFKNYNVTKVVCGGCQTIVLAQKKKSDEKKSDESEEDTGNATLSATQQPKSRARNERIKNLTDRSLNVNSSIDSKIQHARPLGTSNKLRTESDDDGNESNKELSESLKSATFNQTHTQTNGKLRPTQNPALNRTSLRSNDDELRPLRTGALDRTVRLNQDSDDLTKTSNRFPPIDKSPSRNARFEQSSNSPSNIRKKRDSDDDDDDEDDKSPVRKTRSDRTNSPQITRKKQESDDDKPPARNARFEHSTNSPANIRKKQESDDDKSPARNAKFDRNIRRKQSSDDDKSSSEEKPTKSYNKKLEPLSSRNEPKNSPITKRRDDNDSDDNKRRRVSPIKPSASENLNRKTRRRDESEEDDSEEEEDDDEEDRSPRNRNKQKLPPTVTRRGSLPTETRSGGRNSLSRDGNQTIGSRPVDGVRGSMRAPATKTLAKPTSNTDSTKKEEKPAEQPGFFARLFGSKPTPPPPAPTPAAQPASNTNSRTCSIM